MQRFLKNLIKVSIFIIVGLFSLMVIGLFIFQLPSAQTFTANFIANKFIDKTGYEVEIEKAYLASFDLLQIEDLKVLDSQRDSILSFEKAQVTISLIELFRKREFPISSISIMRPKLKMNQDSSGQYAIGDFMTKLNLGSPGKGDPKISLKRILINEGTILFPSGINVPWINKQQLEFQYFSNINLEVNYLKKYPDSLSAQISLIEFEESNTQLALSLHHCQTTILQEKIEFKKFRLQTNGLNIGDQLTLFWEKPNENESRQNMGFKASLLKTTIDPSELGPMIMLKELGFLPTMEIEGNLSYKEGELKLQKGHFQTSTGSVINGNFYLENPKKIRSSFMQAYLSNSKISGKDLQQVSEKLELGLFQKFGFLEIDGFLEGFFNDFVAKGRFNSGLGLMAVDLNFKKDDFQKVPSFSGNIGLSGFALGELLQTQTPVKNVTLEGSIIGRGLNINEIFLIFEGDVRSIEVLDIPFRKIQVKGNLSKKLFSGMIISEDPKLGFDLNGTLNLNDSSQKIDVGLVLKNADLEKMGLTERPAGLQFNSQFNFQGFHPDSIKGQVLIGQLEAYNNEKEIELDSLQIILSGEPKQRSIFLSSDFLELSAKGSFTFESLKEAVPRIRSTLKGIINPKERTELMESDPSFIHSTVELKEINPILSFFKPGLLQGGDGLIELDYFWQNSDHLDLNVSIDTIFYQGNQFIQNRFHYYQGYNPNQGSNLGLEFLGEKQEISNKTSLEDTKILAYHQNGKLDINISTMLEDEDWFQVAINGEGKISHDSLTINFKPNESELTFLGKYWQLNPGQQIVFGNNEMIFDSLGFFTQGEKIWSNGSISFEKSRAEIGFENFKLVNINPFIVHKLSGSASGNLTLNPKSEFENFNTSIQINDLTFNSLLIGDVKADINRPLDSAHYDVVIDIENLGEQYFLAVGTINPEDEYSFDLNSELSEVDLHFLEPILENVMSHIKGTVTGVIKLGGNLKSPEVQGILLVKEGSFKLDYLNTNFRVEDRVIIGIDRILFTNSKVIDETGNPINVTGGIFHDGFKNLVLDMNFDLKNNYLMNILKEDNDLFFGQGYGTGKVKLFGGVRDILIEADIRTDKGSKIFLPFDNAESVYTTDQIQFSSFLANSDEDQKEIKGNSEINLSGLELKANLEITEEAEIQLLLDQSTDDRIWGKGNGKITLEIDTRSDFQMFGNYEITEGIYNFTMLNIINKQFEIDPGSKVSWSGDPYGGQMDVTGFYKQHVSLQPLMISADSLILETSQARRRYPVDVELFLKGELLTPEIGFGIDIKETPVFAGYDFNSDKLAFYNRIENDNDERNRQVFSLIMLRSFSQDGEFYGQNVSGNVSELLSNQLSNYLSQVDENFQIDFDISGFSEADLKNMQLRMSYEFMEGKLSVSREGGFYNSTNEVDASSVIGDWTIEYLLSEDGRVRIRVFNRNNPNVYDVGSDVSSTTTTAGFSLMYTRNFDNFGELFRPSEKKKNPNKP